MRTDLSPRHHLWFHVQQCVTRQETGLVGRQRRSTTCRFRNVRARCACSCHVASNMVGSDFADDGRSGHPTTEVKQHSSEGHQTYPYQCAAIHHKLCFQVDVPPVAQRVSINYADQGQLFASVFPRW